MKNESLTFSKSNGFQIFLSFSSVLPEDVILFFFYQDQIRDRHLESRYARRLDAIILEMKRIIGIDNNPRDHYADDLSWSIFTQFVFFLKPC